MDRPGVDEGDLRRSLTFIRRINRFLGYTHSTLSHIRRFSKSWPARAAIRILDVASGSADVPQAIVRWARRAGHDVQVVALDLHAHTAAIARDETLSEPHIAVVRGNALDLPFADASFDIVLTSMFLHHLDEAEVTRVLAEMNRVASQGILAADLIRDPRAYRWITLFTMFSKPILKHDARVSVAQAFSRAEIERLRDQAGAGYTKYHKHFGHRFVLAGEKRKVSKASASE
jgi:ubiquinone/menaquinone biosynthesis C-methylase UbiE